MRLLIVEDDEPLAETLAAGLRHEGHVVDVARDGAKALAWLDDHPVDVVILDRDLPVTHGDTVCRTLIADGNPARILMLTAASSLDNLVNGFELGADDYLAKPFAYIELRARIEALGRRNHDRGTSIVERGELRIDLRRQVAERRGMPLQLSPKEFGVLHELVAANGAFRTTTNLLDAVWDDPFDRTTDVVKVVIHALRRKLGDADLIETVPGFGYRIA
jgi:DNA-binding response OmpR family regulator